MALGVAAIVVCLPGFAITVRIALKPIVDSILRLREAIPSAGTSGLEGRVRELEAEVRQLRGSVDQLEETVDFQQKLLAGGPTITVGTRDAHA